MHFYYDQKVLDTYMRSSKVEYSEFDIELLKYDKEAGSIEKLGIKNVKILLAHHFEKNGVRLWYGTIMIDGEIHTFDEGILETSNVPPDSFFDYPFSERHRITGPYNYNMDRKALVFLSED